MARLVFDPGQQNDFVTSVMDSLELDSKGVGKIVGISGRSFRDWVNEKT